MAEDIKQENSTYAVKLGGDVKQELLQLLEGYKESSTGANSGDFIKTLLEVYKTNKIIGNVSGGDAELKELNTITNRIYSIYSNLIDRNNTNNNSLQGEFGEQLAQKDISINNLKAKTEELSKENEVLQGAFNTLCEDKKELENTNIQLQKLNDSLEFNNSKLIEDTKGLQEFKEVNHKLADKIETTEVLLASQQADNIDLNNKVNEKESSIQDLNKTIGEMKQANEKVISELNNKHIEEVEQLRDKASIVMDKALLELKKEQQEKLSQEQLKHNAEIQEYQSKYKSLLEELEKKKPTSRVKKSTAADTK